MIKVIFGFFIFPFLKICQTQKMEPYIVNGNFSNIKDFPHSVCLVIGTKYDTWICGASILNQRILLTAAHCLFTYKTSSIALQYGSAYLPHATNLPIKAYKVHPRYNEGTGFGDIGMILTPEPLRLNYNARRVAILPANPPYNEEAFVAGWGRVSVESNIQTDRLKHATQKIMSRRECINTLRINLPDGVICGVGTGFAEKGDSGCALMVRNYIQVGIVSYKEPQINNAIVVYTEIAFFYNWIKDQAQAFLCVA